MKIEPINNKKIYQYITEQIICLIVNGELKAGDKLPSERILAEKFEVSRSSIRESFRAMEIVGIIEVKPGGGTFVTNFNIAPFINTIAPLIIRDVNIKEDLMDFRTMLECEAIKLASDTRDKDSIDCMKQATQRMKKAYQEDNQINGEKADVDFHLSIFKATGNTIYIKAGESLSYILSASVHSNRVTLLKNKDNSMRWYQEHCRILDSIKSGNREKASNELRKHLEGIRELL